MNLTSWLGSKPAKIDPDHSLEVLLLELVRFGEVRVSSWDDNTWWAVIDVRCSVSGAVLHVKSESRVHQTPTAAAAQLLKRVREATGIKA